MTDDIISSIDECNVSGRLALAVYLIYGYPSLEVSQRAFDLLRAHSGTLFEFALPAPVLIAPEISAVIKEAHRVAWGASLSERASLSFYARYRPNVLIDHQGGRQRDTGAFLRRIRDSVDAVMTDDVSLSNALAGRRQGERRPMLIPFVSALSKSPARQFSVETDRLIYLGVSSRTGGKLLPAARIQSAVNAIASAAPDAKILCGFGIRTARDIARLRRVRGIHGVAIGTEALRRLKEGIGFFERWLLDIKGCSSGSE